MEIVYRLDLTNLERSEVKYKKSKFPDGQVSISISTPINTSGKYIIISRMNSYENLFYILATTDVLKYNGVDNIHLFTPCMMAQRSDERFGNGTISLDIKIVADILNAQGYKGVHIYHPHSAVTQGLINNCFVEDNTNLLQWAITSIDEEDMFAERAILVSPDAGAYKKVYKHAETFNRELIAANKCRGKDGEPYLEVHGNVKDRRCIIVDDYCDGGRTFINLSQKLKELGAFKVHLVVSHGLFSAGIGALAPYVDSVYCTNSISDLEHGTFLQQMKLI